MGKIEKHICTTSELREYNNSLDIRLKEIISKIDSDIIRKTLLWESEVMKAWLYSFSLFNENQFFDTKSDLVSKENFIKWLNFYLSMENLNFLLKDNYNEGKNLLIFFLSF